MSNKIFVKDLEIEAIIGIFDWEREVKQLIKISYEVEVDIKKAFKSDNIEAVSYTHLTLPTRKLV